MWRRECLVVVYNRFSLTSARLYLLAYFHYRAGQMGDPGQMDEAHAVAGKAMKAEAHAFGDSRLMPRRMEQFGTDFLNTVMD